MRILWFILLVSEVGFGRCGNPGDGQEVQAKDNRVEDNGQGVSRQEPVKPSPDLASKVDGNLFATEPGNDDGVPTLKLTAKEGVTAKKVTFDGNTVWETGWFKSRDPCSSVMLYFGSDNVPTLAVIYKINKGKEEPKVYRYHDGKKWQDGNETTHKTKLDELKKNPPAPTEAQEEASPGGDTTTLASQLDDPSSDNTPQNVQDGPQNVQHNGESSEQSKDDSPSPEDTPQGNTQPASSEEESKPQEATPGQPATPPTGQSNVLVKQSDKAPEKAEILDLKSSSVQTCRAFSINIKGIPTHVFIMHPDVKITEVKSDQKEVWKQTMEEVCTCCIAFLKDDDKPNVVIVMMDSGGKDLIQGDRVLQSEKWELITGSISDSQTKDLKKNTDKPTNFSIDLSTTSDTDKCNVVTFEKDGLTSRFYVPKVGHVIEKVVVGETEVWKSTDSKLCFLCEYYSKEKSEVLRVHAEGGYKISCSYYEKDGQTWKSMEKKDFNEKFKKMAGIST